MGAGPGCLVDERSRLLALSVALLSGFKHRRGSPSAEFRSYKQQTDSKLLQRNRAANGITDPLSRRLLRTLSQIRGQIQVSITTIWCSVYRTYHNVSWPHLSQQNCSYLGYLSQRHVLIRSGVLIIDLVRTEQFLSTSALEEPLEILSWRVCLFSGHVCICYVQDILRLWRHRSSTEPGPVVEQVMHARV